MRKTRSEIWSEIERDAERFRKDNSQLGLTVEQAIDRVLTPAKYREYAEAENTQRQSVVHEPGATLPTVLFEWENGVKLLVLPAVARRLEKARERARERRGLS